MFLSAHAGMVGLRSCGWLVMRCDDVWFDDYGDDDDDEYERLAGASEVFYSSLCECDALSWL